MTHVPVDHDQSRLLRGISVGIALGAISWATIVVGSYLVWLLFVWRFGR